MEAEDSEFDANVHWTAWELPLLYMDKSMNIDMNMYYIGSL